MLIKWLAFIAFFVTNFKAYRCVNYDRFGVYNVFITSRDHMVSLKNVADEKYLEVDFWTKPFKVNSSVQVMVNRDNEQMFLERMEHFSLRSELLIPNLQEAFNKQTLKKYVSPNVDHWAWDAYYNLDDINQWLKDLVIKYPRELEIISIGKTTEMRHLYVLHIHKGHSNNDVIVEAGLNGHEWVTTVFVTYMIAKLVHDRDSGDSSWRTLAKKYNWYMIPVANPDGFEYTHTEDRLWRKNRRELSTELFRRNMMPLSSLGNVTKIKKYYGVDLNRNFNVSFGTRSANEDPRARHYCGEKPFSEQESWSLAEFIKSKAKTLKFYYSFHAYGQKIVIPYAESVQHVDNYLHLAKIARLSIEKMHGVSYEVGTYYDVFGETVSGSSASWVKKNLNIDYVYTFYLRDNGTFGHALPADQLEAACQETLTALTAIMTAKTRRVGRSGSFELDRAEIITLSYFMIFACTLFTSFLTIQS